MSSVRGSGKSASWEMLEAKEQTGDPQQEAMRAQQAATERKIENAAGLHPILSKTALDTEQPQAGRPSGKGKSDAPTKTSHASGLAVGKSPSTSSLSMSLQGSGNDVMRLRGGAGGGPQQPSSFHPYSRPTQKTSSVQTSAKKAARTQPLGGPLGTTGLTPAPSRTVQATSGSSTASSAQNTTSFSAPQTSATKGQQGSSTSPIKTASAKAQLRMKISQQLASLRTQSQNRRGQSTMLSMPAQPSSGAVPGHPAHSQGSSFSATNQFSSTGQPSNFIGPVLPVNWSAPSTATAHSQSAPLSAPHGVLSIAPVQSSVVDRTQGVILISGEKMISCAQWEASNLQFHQSVHRDLRSPAVLADVKRIAESPASANIPGYRFKNDYNSLTVPASASYRNNRTKGHILRADITTGRVVALKANGDVITSFLRKPGQATMDYMLNNQADDLARG